MPTCQVQVYNLHCVCAYGGGNKYEQSKVFEQGAEIAIATPGRMIDLVKMKVERKSMSSTVSSTSTVSSRGVPRYLIGPRIAILWNFGGPRCLPRPR